MPTKTTRRGKLRWRGVVKQNGKIVASKWFGSGKQEYKKAVVWEEEEKQRLQEEAQKETPTDSLSFLDWSNEYLNDAQKRFVKKTYEEKLQVFKQFLLFAQQNGRELEEMNPAFAMKYLQAQYEASSGYSANKHRKNLATAWEWGRDFVEGFPKEQINPFKVCKKFPEERSPRYVPPIEDFDKVLSLAQGQDHVMLTAFLHLAARRGELFRLTWSDVDFAKNQVCLSTRKTRGSSMKRVWLPLSSELRKELLWWWENRPYKQAEHVFTVLDDSPSPCHNPGGPFKYRQHFMKTICKQAKVKTFGFHAIRHLSASYLYRIGKPLSLIQRILRHEAPTTTERYLKSLGFETEELGSAVEEFTKRGPGKVIPFSNEKAPGGASSEG
jgi:integrase